MRLNYLSIKHAARGCLTNQIIPDFSVEHSKYMGGNWRGSGMCKKNLAHFPPHGYFVTHFRTHQQLYKRTLRPE